MCYNIYSERQLIGTGPQKLSDDRVGCLLNTDNVRRSRGTLRVCHPTRSSRVLLSVVGAFGWVGKGVIRVRVASPTKIKKTLDKSIQV